jgi:hypothetical protein
MAKLLQRVRGESSGGSASVISSHAPPMKPSTPTLSASPQPTQFVSAPLPPSTADASGRNADDEVKEVPVNWDAIARRAAAAVPATDLGALRALANETARRAIGRHELKKHRRDAMTKVIVSSLAGVTSLWLMLDAPTWLDIQFITACVSLIVAAYWAGETFRALLESLRAAAYDGPETDSATSAAPDEAAPKLPIDVR